MEETNLDFDNSSYEWRKNKIYMGKGVFKYKCNYNNCDNLLYCYITQNKQFKLFASDFDIINKNNPNQFKYCEIHLLEK